jgi:hypothetical protein
MSRERIDELNKEIQLILKGTIMGEAVQALVDYIKDLEDRIARMEFDKR